MKRYISLILVLITLLLCGCSAGRTDISRQEIFDAYTAAGYQVDTQEYDEPMEFGQIAYLKAGKSDTDFIYFTFFETEQAANAYKEQTYHPAMIGLFSIIFGDPTWLRFEVIGCIVVEYEDSDYFKILEEIR